LSSRFDCFSARYSFNDLLGFLTFCFFGDLSPMATSLLIAASDARAAFTRCGAQRSNHPLVTRDAERRAVTTSGAGGHVPPTESRTYRSTLRGFVEDHAVTLSNRPFGT
jgi:hypothetical protein